MMAFWKHDFLAEKSRRRSNGVLPELFDNVRKKMEETKPQRTGEGESVPSITTKNGDGGRSSVMFGGMMRKDEPIFEFLGTIDELNSHIGLCLCYSSANLSEMLREIQNILFDIGSSISTDSNLSLEASNFTRKLEEWGCILEKALPPLRSFILPGGCVSSSNFHIARAVCRRCERDGVHCGYGETKNPEAIRILNRLSDFLFIAARYENKENSVVDITWKPKRDGC